MRPLVSLLGPILILVLAGSPASAAERRDLNSVFGEVVVDRQIEGNVNCAFGDVKVNEPVNGSVSAGFGDVYLNAPVRGKVEVDYGDVYVARGVPRDRISVDGGEVYSGGEMVEREPGPANAFSGSVLFPEAWNSFGGFLRWLLGSIGFAACAVLLAAALPRVMGGVARSVESSPGWSFLWGVISFPVAVVVSVALAISVVGVPLLLAIMALYLGALFFGALAVAHAIGRRILLVIGGHRAGEPVAAAVGAIVVAFLYLIPYLSAVLLPAISLLGLGAAVVALFSRRGASYFPRGAYYGGS